MQLLSVNFALFARLLFNLHNPKKQQPIPTLEAKPLRMQALKMLETLLLMPGKQQILHSYVSLLCLLELLAFAFTKESDSVNYIKRA